jgi:hypothetical protein
MPNVSIDKTKFLEILDQFKYDIPYEVELVKRLLANMPEQASKYIIEELYFTRIHNGPVFKVVHYIYQDDIHWFTNQKALLEFLKERNMEFTEEFWQTIDGRTLDSFIKKRNPLCGYIISKEEMKND